MIRAQIYLTDKERHNLHVLSKASGKSQSELIREAIDFFFEQNKKQKTNKLALIESIKGIWRDRMDLADFPRLRSEFDRKIGNKE